jgi:hypothetical protein
MISQLITTSLTPFFSRTITITPKKAFILKSFSSSISTAVTGLTSDQIGYDRVLEKISLILSNVTDKNLLSKVLAIHPDYDVTRFLLQVNFGQLIIIYFD